MTSFSRLGASGALSVLGITKQAAPALTPVGSRMFMGQPQITTRRGAGTAPAFTPIRTPVPPAGPVPKGFVQEDDDTALARTARSPRPPPAITTVPNRRPRPIGFDQDNADAALAATAYRGPGR